MPHTRPRWAWIGSIGMPAVLSLAAFCVYLATTAPGLTWSHEGADGGDLITAAYTLGIPHPPGYPLYVLIGRLFAALPMGNVAYRLNIMSATCASLTIFLFYRWTWDWLQRSTPQLPDTLATAAASSSSALLAFSRLFWSQAIIAEVYTLNALAFILVLSLFWRWETPSPRSPTLWLALGALVLGLGLGNHVTLLFLLPPLLYWVLSSPRRRELGWREAILVGACFLGGLSIYLYLPVRAMAKPPLDWGDPVTWGRFVWMVSGALYRHYVYALPLGFVPVRLAKWAGDLVWQFGPWGVALGLMGIWELAAGARRVLLFTASIFLLYSAYAIGYNTADSFVYLLPAYIVWALWIGRGVLSAWDMLGGSWQDWRHVVSIVLVLCCLPLISVLWNWPALDLSQDHEATAYMSAVLEALPPEAIVITASDRHTFSLWYVQQVEGERPDVLVLDRDLLPYEWYRDTVLPRYPRVNIPPDDRDAFTWLTAFLDANIPSFPVSLTDPDERLMARYVTERKGPVYQLSVR